jgi:riboflavin kinase/FMN adenylyltransferase
MSVSRSPLARPQVEAPLVIVGTVQHGRQLARTLGFPTANVRLPKDSPAAFGVYATRTLLADGRMFDGVASIGTNPTFGAVDPVLEVWLFDFDEDIYGQTVRVALVAFLREERTYASAEALVDQVARDAEAARQRLSTDPMVP